MENVFSASSNSSIVVVDERRSQTVCPSPTHLLAIESEIAGGTDVENLLSLASQTALTDRATPLLVISLYESNESSAPTADTPLLFVLRDKPLDESSCKISTPSILIDNYESGTVVTTVHSESIHLESMAEVMTVQKETVQSYEVINSNCYPQSAIVSDLTTTGGNGAINKENDTNHLKGAGSDQEADVETACESETTRHHSRLLRLLSNSNETITGPIDTTIILAPKSVDSTAAVESPSETAATTIGGDEVFPPPPPPGVRLRIRSRRARDRIPSRVFRSLQHDFDSSSTEDIHQEYQEMSSSSVIQYRTTGVDGPPNSNNQQQPNVFRFSHLFASITPETPSSANSEMEGFFLPSHQYSVHQHQTGN